VLSLFITIVTVIVIIIINVVNFTFTIIIINIVFVVIVDPLSLLHHTISTSSSPWLPMIMG
jgi:hypothetical protein